MRGHAAPASRAAAAPHAAAPPARRRRKALAWPCRLHAFWPRARRLAAASRTCTADAERCMAAIEAAGAACRPSGRRAVVTCHAARKCPSPARTFCRALRVAVVHGACTLRGCSSTSRLGVSSGVSEFHSMRTCCGERRSDEAGQARARRPLRRPRCGAGRPAGGAHAMPASRPRGCRPALTTPQQPRPGWRRSSCCWRSSRRAGGPPSPPRGCTRRPRRPPSRPRRRACRGRTGACARNVRLSEQPGADSALGRAVRARLLGVRRGQARTRRASAARGAPCILGVHRAPVLLVPQHARRRRVLRAGVVRHVAAARRRASVARQAAT